MIFGASCQNITHFVGVILRCKPFKFELGQIIEIHFWVAFFHQSSSHESNYFMIKMKIVHILQLIKILKF